MYLCNLSRYLGTYMFQILASFVSIGNHYTQLTFTELIVGSSININPAWIHKIIEQKGKFVVSMPNVQLSDLWQRWQHAVAAAVNFEASLEAIMIAYQTIMNKFSLQWHKLEVMVNFKLNGLKYNIITFTLCIFGLLKTTLSIETSIIDFLVIGWKRFLIQYVYRVWFIGGLKVQSVKARYYQTRGGRLDSRSGQADLTGRTFSRLLWENSIFDHPEVLKKYPDRLSICYFLRISKKKHVLNC